jgi:hypothetical protein
VTFVFSLALVSRHHSLSGLVTWVTFGLMFLAALRLLDDPGDDLPPTVWVTPVALVFAMILGLAGGIPGWEKLLFGYLLCVIAVWMTSGPWLGPLAWRRVLLALITPLLLALSLGGGMLAERWLPALMLK